MCYIIYWWRNDSNIYPRIHLQIVVLKAKIWPVPSWNYNIFSAILRFWLEMLNIVLNILSPYFLEIRITTNPKITIMGTIATNHLMWLHKNQLTAHQVEKFQSITFLIFLEKKIVKPIFLKSFFTDIVPKTFPEQSQGTQLRTNRWEKIALFLSEIPR